MEIVNDFHYKRKFFVRDLPRPETVFSKCEQLEFDSFESFINNYLSKDYMIVNTGSIKRLIIPVSTSGQISVLKGIENNTATYILYIKNINPEILVELKDITSKNFGILLDFDKVVKFKDALFNLPLEYKNDVLSILWKTHGAFRIFLNKDNLNDFLDNITEPFLRFPFFNYCDLQIQYHTFEETLLKDLHQLLYDFKFIYRNFITIKPTKEINWTFFNPSLSPLSYPFSFMKRDGSELYIKNNMISLTLEDSPLPEYSCDFLIQDGNYMNKEILDRFLGATSLRFDIDLFVSKYENYLCNNNLTSPPYLNRIIYNIVTRGDI